ncbi:MAG: class I SAM-dependent RNA methyltransferase [Kofleriaceae bacterium]
MIVDDLRIVGSTQTNVVMEAELIRVAQRALGRRPPKVRKDGLGQIVMPFDRDLAWAAVTYLRTPTRVLWDVVKSDAERLEPLYDDVLGDLLEDRRELWRDGDGISVESRRVENFPAGERQVVGTIKNAIIDAARRRGATLHVDADRPATRWVARQDDRGEMVVSIDLGAGSLSQRGWRREAGEAPLREHLAAVLLMLARFDPRHDILVDPMCGAGTIPIEAVLAARAVPRKVHTLGVLGLRGPRYKPEEARARSSAGGAAKVDDEKPGPLFPDASPLVIGCDVDLQVLAAARDNARSAGVTDDIVWQRADVRALGPAMIEDIAREKGREVKPGLILCNPPYGERLDDHDLRELYAALAYSVRAFKGWRAAFIVSNPLLEEVFFQIVGPPRIKKPLANANLRAYFYLYDVR